MKKSPFDSLFSSETSMFLPPFFSSFEKVSFMALYSKKKGAWGGSQTMWDLFQTNFIAKKLSLHSFWNPSCVHMPVHVCSCNKHAYVWLECAYAYACMRVHT